MNIKNKIQFIPIAIMVIVAVWFLAVTDSPEMKQRVEAAKIVFDSINFMPGSSLTDSSASNKNDSVLVDGYFETDAIYEQIKAYYLNELNAEGWIFDSESGSEKDTYGKPSDTTLNFHKDVYVLEVNYYDDPDQGYTYDIAIMSERQ